MFIYIKPQWADILKPLNEVILGYVEQKLFTLDISQGSQKCTKVIDD